MELKKIKTKLERLKKGLWNEYPQQLNIYFDAFETMRQVGDLQGEYKTKEKIIEMIEKMDLKDDREKIIQEIKNI